MLKKGHNKNTEYHRILTVNNLKYDEALFSTISSEFELDEIIEDVIKNYITLKRFNRKELQDIESGSVRIEVELYYQVNRLLTYNLIYLNTKIMSKKVYYNSLESLFKRYVHLCVSLNKFSEAINNELNNYR